MPYKCHCTRGDIPAHIKTQIDVISKLKDDQTRLEEEFSAAVKNIAETKQISDSGKKKLRLQFEVLGSQLREKILRSAGLSILALRFDRHQADRAGG